MQINVIQLQLCRRYLGSMKKEWIHWEAKGGHHKGGSEFELDLEKHIGICQTGRLRWRSRQRNSTYKGKDYEEEW